MNVDHLRPFATARQCEILDAVKKHGSVAEASRQLKIGDRRIRDHLQRMRAKADSRPVAKLHRTLAVPDLHAPYHHERDWAVTLSAINTVRPDEVVVLGDFADCYSVSRFPKDPTRRSNLRWELDRVNEELDRLQSAVSYGATVTYCEGNHEARLFRALCHVPEFHGMLEISRELRIAPRGWRWVPYGDWHQIGRMSYSHDLGRCGLNALRQSLIEFGHNLCIGHTHLAGVVYEGQIDGECHVGLNCGWLGNPELADYVHRAKARKWPRGFGWIEQTEDGSVWPSFRAIVDGTVNVDGKVIKA